MSAGLCFVNRMRRRADHSVLAQDYIFLTEQMNECGMTPHAERLTGCQVREEAMIL
jgi:hypothetical protein